MEYLSQNKFAKLVGVSPQAVSLAVKSGRVIRCKSGIDPLHPSNQHYAEAAADNSKKRKRGQHPPRKKRGRPKGASSSSRRSTAPPSRPAPAPGAAPPFEPEQDIDWTTGELPANISALSRSTTDKLKTIEQIHALRIKSDKERKDLIERTLVRRLFSKLYLIDTNEIKTLADKLPAELAAIMGVDDRELIMKVGATIETEVYKTLAHIKRLINDLLDEIEAEQIP